MKVRLCQWCILEDIIDIDPFALSNFMKNRLMLDVILGSVLCHEVLAASDGLSLSDRVPRDDRLC